LKAQNGQSRVFSQQRCRVNLAPGCQIFIDKMYQNGERYTKLPHNTGAALILLVLSLNFEGRRQGDQIGRIFAHWETIYSGKFFLKITEVAKIFWYYFFKGYGT
jgi:hypothetical protein